MTTNWGVSTGDGATLSADELVGTLASHHDRVITAWGSLSPDQWSQPSRNSQWSCHETARHVADCLEFGAAEMNARPARFTLTQFDPRATPDTWLAESAEESPEQTIERFASCAPVVRERVGERLAAGDDSDAVTPYGTAHWTVNVVHLFWDSWLHERDVLIPLGLPAESTPNEQRLAAIYSLLMAVVPTKMMGQDLTATIEFTGPQGQIVVAAHESGRISSIETPDAATTLSAEVCSLADALSGRGASLRDLLPDAPELLYFFADYMAG